MRMKKSTFDLTFGPKVDGVGGNFLNGENLSVLLTLAEHTDGCRECPSFATRPKKRILEMYCNLGSTAVALASIPSAPEVYAFDVCKESGVFPLDRSDEVVSKRDAGSAIERVAPEVRKRITFETAAPGDLKSLYREFSLYDLVFIDGNHTWRGVAEDTKLAIQFVADCGVIVWDDYWDACPEVVSYIDVLNRRIGDRVAWVEETRMCYIRLTAQEKAILKREASDL